jgi:DNA-binding SARP family transcriptional activator
MRFGVLGSVVVAGDGVLARVRASMPRSVLAALLLSANRVVGVERLMDVVWGDDPPPAAAGALQNHVMRLRWALGPAASRLRTMAPGYVLEVGEGELDLEMFERWSAEGQRALQAGEWGAASRDLRAALALWRGDALADVRSQALRDRDVPRLEELRLETVEGRVEADLHLGRQEDLIRELPGLVATYSFRERLHGQLMMAYCRAGRPAEALGAFARARKVLAEELGADPGPSLQELHQRVLTGDPDLRPPGPAAGRAAERVGIRPVGRLRSTRRRTPRPVQLPAGLADFTGRSADVAWLAGVVARAGERGGVVPTGVVTGLGGIGTTSLAVHVAHQVCDQFPDGQLFARLSMPGAPPAAAGEVLGGFLRALGVDAGRFPEQEAERAVMLRSALAGRRVLMVLDDARDGLQVAPLLPGTAGCAVIVTSRGPLAGLSGARVRRLRPLAQDESAAMLAGIIGVGRAQAEPEAVAVIAEHCGGLPLALRLAGDLLVARPHWRVADLAARLASPSGCLDALAIGGLSVRSVFEGSYAALPGGKEGVLARAFGLLGPLDGHDITPAMAAALLGSGMLDAEVILDALVDWHVLNPGSAPGHYCIPPLLGAYAVEIARHRESRQQTPVLTNGLTPVPVHLVSGGHSRCDWALRSG